MSAIFYCVLVLLDDLATFCVYMFLMPFSVHTAGLQL